MFYFPALVLLSGMESTPTTMTYHPWAAPPREKGNWVAASMQPLHFISRFAHHSLVSAQQAQGLREVMTGF